MGGTAFIGTSEVLDPRLDVLDPFEIRMVDIRPCPGRPIENLEDLELLKLPLGRFGDKTAPFSGRNEGGELVGHFLRKRNVKSLNFFLHRITPPSFDVLHINKIHHFPEMFNVLHGKREMSRGRRAYMGSDQEK
jgi:hypothetical protein